MNNVRHAALQKRLDFLDELIDTLDREKQRRATTSCLVTSKRRGKSSKWRVKLTVGANCKRRGFWLTASNAVFSLVGKS